MRNSRKISLKDVDRSVIRDVFDPSLRPPPACSAMKMVVSDEQEKHLEEIQSRYSASDIKIVGKYKKCVEIHLAESEFMDFCSRYGPMHIFPQGTSPQTDCWFVFLTEEDHTSEILDSMRTWCNEFSDHIKSCYLVTNIDDYRLKFFISPHSLTTHDFDLAHLASEKLGDLLRQYHTRIGIHQVPWDVLRDFAPASQSQLVYGDEAQ